MRKKLIALTVLAMVALNVSMVFAAEPNPHVTIVNPTSENTLYSDSLLVSVKLTQPVTIEVSAWQVWKVVNEVNEAITLEEYQRARLPDSRIEIAQTEFLKMEPFTSANNLSFYTKKIENITPGVYVIQVDTLNAEGKVIHTDASVVSMKAKEENLVDPAASNATQSGPSQFLKNLLKSIFGN